MSGESLVRWLSPESDTVVLNTLGPGQGLTNTTMLTIKGATDLRDALTTLLTSRTEELILMYAVALPDLNAMGEPEWSTAPEHNDPEAEWQIVTVCTGCGEISQDGDHVVTERDTSTRHNEASLNVYDESEGLDVMVNVRQTDDFYETDGYDCAHCGVEVTLPNIDGFGVDWP